MEKNSASSNNNLIFIHGWGTSSVVWKNQVGYFSKKYQLCTTDLPGHGTNLSPGNFLNYQLPITNYGSTSSPSLEPSRAQSRGQLPIFIAWSYGGMLSMQIAAQDAGNLRALVLVSSTAKFTDDNMGLKLTVVKNIKRNLQRNFPDTMRNCYGTFFSEGERGYIPGFIKEQALPDEESAVNILDELMALDLRDSLKEINVPTLIIHGDKDGVCPVGAGRFLHENIRGSRLEIIPGAGHAPFYTRAGEFNKILDAFLKDVK